MALVVAGPLQQLSASFGASRMRCCARWRQVAPAQLQRAPPSVRVLLPLLGRLQCESSTTWCSHSSRAAAVDRSSSRKAAIARRSAPVELQIQTDGGQAWSRCAREKRESVATCYRGVTASRRCCEPFGVYVSRGGSESGRWSIVGEVTLRLVESWCKMVGEEAASNGNVSIKVVLMVTWPMS